MKRIFGLVVVFAALFATAAFGAQFGRLAVDVAAGWTASQDGSTVAIVKDDNTASMSVTIESMDGASLEELAAAFAQQLNGTEPQQITEGDFAGDYVFEFTNANGVKSEGLISGDGTDYMLVVVTGVEGNEAADADARAMIASFALQ